MHMALVQFDKQHEKLYTNRKFKFVQQFQSTNSGWLLIGASVSEPLPSDVNVNFVCLSVCLSVGLSWTVRTA